MAYDASFGGQSPSFSLDIPDRRRMNSFGPCIFLNLGAAARRPARLPENIKDGVWSLYTLFWKSIQQSIWLKIGSVRRTVLPLSKGVNWSSDWGYWKRFWIVLDSPWLLGSVEKKSSILGRPFNASGCNILVSFCWSKRCVSYNESIKEVVKSRPINIFANFTEYRIINSCNDRIHYLA